MGVIQGRGSVSGGGSGAAPVLATAAIIDDTQGRFTFSPALLEMMNRRMRRGEGPLDTVLFAREASYALLLRLPEECHLVGVVAEREMGFVPPTRELAIVSGAAGALSMVQDGDWVIVDPARGRVVINPDAQEIARLQSFRTSRPSFLLGAAHTPALTLSGRQIAVWSIVRTITDINVALQQGVDGILIAEDSELIADVPWDADDEAEEMVFALLAQAADAMGGGEVAIAADMEAIHPRTIVRLAARCRLCWAFRPSTLPYPMSELIDEMNALIDEEEENGGGAALPRLAALVTAAPDAGADDLSLIDFDEALWDSPTPFPHSFGFLPPIVRVVVPDHDMGEELSDSVALGATCVIVSPERVSLTKDIIRQQP